MAIEQDTFSELNDLDGFAMGTNGKRGIRGTINALRETLSLPRRTRSWDESQSRQDRLSRHLNLEDNPEI